MKPYQPAMRRTTALFVVLLGLGHVAGAQPAADDRATTDEAARLYDEGKRHFDIGDYAQAIASWKQAYLRSSAPLLLFNIAQAYRLSNNCAQANRFYLNYRRSEQHPNNQAELDKAMARCAGVEPATGDTAEPPAPTPSTPAPAPTGAPAPTVGTPTPTSGAPAAGPTTGAPPAPDPGGTWRTAGLITGAVGAAALVVGGVYANQAREASNTVSDARTGTPYTGDVASADRSGKTAASRAKGLLGAGAVLAVAGGAMWYVGHRRGGAQVDVAITPGHAEVTLSCAF